MAEFYAHERVAKRAAELIGEHGGGRPSAFLTGAGRAGPDVLPRLLALQGAGASFRKLGLHLHAVRCPEFLWELVAGARQACRRPIRWAFYALCAGSDSASLYL